MTAEQIRRAMPPLIQVDQRVYHQAAHDAEVLRRLREELAERTEAWASENDPGDAYAVGKADGYGEALAALDRLMVEVPYE